MSIVKFKISLNECKKHGLYDSNSSFFDLERNLQKKCNYIKKLDELRNDKNIDKYRESIHKNKKYEKTSISIRFDLPENIISRYGLNINDKQGKKLFQNEYIFKKEQYNRQNMLFEDINALEKRKIGFTKKEALINARVGQGKFRSQVLLLWKNKCCVTGSTTIDAIRASHIKPWRDSTDEERLDPHNGLPLIANLDALFDAGLISFESSGKLIVSSSLSERERSIFQIELRSLRNMPSELTEEYLVYHRKRVFRK
jgi:predicted restriction endonuclease